jgi:hypothetical protein
MNRGKNHFVAALNGMLLGAWIGYVIWIAMQH